VSDDDVWVADPYRWLEDPDSPETRAFVEAQNALTAATLAAGAPDRARFLARLQAVFDFPKWGVPSERGGRLFYFYNPGLANQATLVSVAADAQSTTSADAAASHATAVTLVDPNTLSADGTVAMHEESFSDDGRYMSYELASGGSDWRTVRVMQIDGATGKGTLLADELKFVKFSNEAWTADSKGFFYARYAPPSDGGSALGTGNAAVTGQEVWYHTAGTLQGADQLVLALPDHPTWTIGADVSDDGRWAFFSLSPGTGPENKLWALDLGALPRNASDNGALSFAGVGGRAAGDDGGPAGTLPVIRLVDDLTASWSYVASLASSGDVVLRTNAGAPRYRLVRGNPAALAGGAPGAALSTQSMPATAAAATAAAWPDVLSEHPTDTLEWATALQGDTALVHYLRDVASVLQARSLDDGRLIAGLPLPGLGSVSGASTRRGSPIAYFNYASFTEPGTVFRWDGAAPLRPPTVFRRTAVPGYDPASLETTQEWATSADGTRLPVFVTGRRGAPRDGARPAILYGYGGFNVAVTPSFSASRALWMTAYDGVFASATLRGGGEYGTAWRDAGSVLNKQRVFDDFGAAAAMLAAKRFTAPGRLAVQGGSNGGTLAAATANQHPDLIAAALVQVGVHDMARFPRFTIGHAWTTDFGDPANGTELAAISKWSPLHNVARPGPGGSGQYPAMLLTTGDHDDRVPPLHSYKLAATLQSVLAGAPGGWTTGAPDAQGHAPLTGAAAAAADAASPQRNPILLRVETRAGHGAGKPTSKSLEELADLYGFVAGVTRARWVDKWAMGHGAVDDGWVPPPGEAV
jgi:prolyl oligopeptidase